jgi:hypothetical protein
MSCYNPGMKKLLLVAAVAVVGFAGWRLTRSSKVEVMDGDTHLALDRLWIDHLPKNERDTIQVFALLSEQPVGVFQATSAWAGAFEIFRYESKGNEFRAVFPQNGAKEKFKVNARECHEGGMDYCLEIKGSDHGVKRYYSNEGWEIGSVADEQKLVDKLSH